MTVTAFALSWSGVASPGHQRTFDSLIGPGEHVTEEICARTVQHKFGFLAQRHRAPVEFPSARLHCDDMRHARADAKQDAVLKPKAARA